MKLAIMQPYFFPYLGYWQLIQAVDRFVIYDDVNYIKNGWINRNRILVNNQPCYMTIPLFQASSFKKICDITMQPSMLWRIKLLKMIENTYRRAPYFDEVFPVVRTIIEYDTDSLVEYVTNQLITLSRFMGIQTEFIITSRQYKNEDLSGQERILDICKKENATTYINPIGGQELYNGATFAAHGIILQFIKMIAIQYKQRCGGFISGLSIVDILMENGVKETGCHLKSYSLVQTNHD